MFDIIQEMGGRRWYRKRYLTGNEDYILWRALDDGEVVIANNADVAQRVRIAPSIIGYVLSDLIEMMAEVKGE